MTSDISSARPSTLVLQYNTSRCAARLWAVVDSESPSDVTPTLPAGMVLLLFPIFTLLLMPLLLLLLVIYDGVDTYNETTIVDWYVDNDDDDVELCQSIC